MTGKRLNRQSLLQSDATSIGSLAPNGNELVVSTDAAKASDIYVVKGTIDNPISKAKRETLREQAMEEYQSATGEAEKMTIRPGKTMAMSATRDSPGKGNGKAKNQTEPKGRPEVTDRNTDREAVKARDKKIAEGEIEKEKKNAQYEGNPKKTSVRDIPDSNEWEQTGDAKVVGYAFGVGADGVPRSYTGFADDPTSASMQTGDVSTDEARTQSEAGVHSELDEEVDEITQKIESSGSDVSTDGYYSSITSTYNLNLNSENTISYYNSPYGALYITYNWYSKSFGDDYAFGCHSPTRVYPGFQWFDSDYNTHDWMVEHDHGESDLDHVSWDSGGYAPQGYSRPGNVEDTWYSPDFYENGIFASLYHNYSEPPAQRHDYLDTSSSEPTWQWDLMDWYGCNSPHGREDIQVNPTSVCHQHHDGYYNDARVSEGEVSAMFENCDRYSDSTFMRTYFNTTVY